MGCEGLLIWLFGCLDVGGRCCLCMSEAADIGQSCMNLHHWKALSRRERQMIGRLDMILIFER